MFALGERVDATPEDAATVERVLGIAPSGRRHHVYDAEPWLTGPAEAIFAAAEVVALPKVLQAVETATHAELETARQFVVALFRYLPLMARMMAVLFEDENYAGMAGLQRVDERPELVLLMVPWLSEFCARDGRRTCRPSPQPLSLCPNWSPRPIRS